MLAGLAVALDVAGDFGIPIFLVGGGHAAMGFAAVPEAAIDKDGKAVLGEDEVGSAGDGRVAAPAFEAGSAEESDEKEFGGFVAAGTDFPHDGGALGFGEGVGHGLKFWISRRDCNFLKLRW